MDLSKPDRLCDVMRIVLLPHHLQTDPKLTQPDPIAQPEPGNGRHIDGSLPHGATLPPGSRRCPLMSQILDLREGL